MRPYKRISKGALTLIITGAFVTGGTVSAGTQVLAQETSISSMTSPQTQDQLSQKSGGVAAYDAPGKKSGTST